MGEMMSDNDLKNTENEAAEKEESQGNNNSQRKAPIIPVAHVVTNNIFMLLSLSLQHMGITPEMEQAEEPQSDIDLEEARLAIDLCDLLLQRIKNKLAAEECKGLEDMLANARFCYVRLVNK